MKTRIWGALLALWAFAVPVLAAPAPLHWEPLGEPGSGGWITSFEISPHDPKRMVLGGDMLGAALSEDGGQRWQATFGFKSWEINDATFHPTDPQVVWLGTLMGPYKSVDGGHTWVEQRNGFPPQANFGYSAPVERVLFDPNDSQHLIAFGGSSRGWDLPGQKPLWGAVWESKDSGAGWAKIATIGAEGNTDDSQKGINIYGAAFAAGSSSTLYASSPWAGFFVSNDGGKTWKKRNAGLPSGKVARVQVHPKDPKTLWLSADAGQTWTQANDGLAMLRGHAIGFNPFDSAELIYGTFGRGFFKTHWPKDFKPAGGKSYQQTGADATFALATADVPQTPTTNAANDPSAGPPPRARPNVPGWGYWPQFPQAWVQTHNGFVQRTKQGRKKNDINVIFFGDSITQGWGGAGKEVWGKRYAKLDAVNYGIGGDSTRQVLWRLQNGEVEGLHPKVVVLKIGTNNLYNDFNAGSDEAIAEGITAIVKTLRDKLPDAKILLLGILPRQNDYFSNRARHINAIIAKLDDGQRVRFLDLSDKFQTAIGKVKPELYGADQLHLIRPGYELWAGTMQPLFEEMLK